MPDDRYLDGDPNASAVCYLDTSGFVAATAQECQLIVDLLAAGRIEDARAHAVQRGLLAKRLLQTLEVPTLPEVDVEQTRDTLRPALWQFKTRPAREPER